MKTHLLHYRLRAARLVTFCGLDDYTHDVHIVEDTDDKIEEVDCLKCLKHRNSYDSWKRYNQLKGESNRGVHERAVPDR